MKRWLTTVVALLVVLAIAGGTTSAATGGHIYRGEFNLESSTDRGKFHLSLRFHSSSRSWVIGRAATASSFVGSGAYAGMRGRGPGFATGGRATTWYARVEGLMTIPGKGQQRVVIKLKGRPAGSFVLTPKEPGFLSRDEGEFFSTWTG
jgi:hypothetical protein